MFLRLCSSCLVLTAWLSAQALADQAPNSLLPQPLAGFQQAHLVVNADWPRFTAVQIDPPELLFQPDWQKQQGLNPNDSQWHSLRLRYCQLLQARLNQVLVASGAFTAATAASPNTLRVHTQLQDFQLAAPELLQNSHKTQYVQQVGQAVLTITLSESHSGRVLAQLTLKGHTRNRQGEPLIKADRTRNVLDYQQLFDRWSQQLLAVIQPPSAQP